MRERLKRIGVRQAGTFVMIAVIVSVSVVMIGREFGIGREAAAVPEAASVGPTAEPADSPPATSKPAAEPQESEPEQSIRKLELALDAAPYCETGGGVGFSGSVLEYDDDGNPVGRTNVDLGYGRIAETDVRWTVTGGTAPYLLMIDNEPRDGRGVYEGASGVASVSCAPKPGEVLYDDYEEKRRYREDPMIDSGPKTIRAVVTDAAGATATASIGIYVILQASDSDTPLTAGETYRLNGTLFTIPDGVEARIGGYEESHGGETIFDIVFYLDGHKGIVGFGVNSGTQIGNRLIGRLSSATAAISGQAEQDDPEAALDSLFDELVDSVGQPPVVGAP